MSFLANFDAFPDSEFRVRTKIGAIVSIVSILIMTILFISETLYFLTYDVKPKLSVDTQLGTQIQINVDIDFPHIPCAYISINSMDKTGNYQLDLHHNLYTTRLDPNGTAINEKPEKEVVGEDYKVPDVKVTDEVEIGECGSCYGAESETYRCCQTCDDVQTAYRQKGWAFTDVKSVKQCIKEHYMEKLEAQKDEGCRVHGYLYVARVAGNLNIVPGKFIVQNSRYVVDSNLYQFGGGFNMSHKVNKLSFGVPYPGMKNPLDGMTKIWGEKEGSPMYEYFVQVVPTSYTYINNSVTETNQYSVTEYVEKINLDDHGMGTRGIPGLFFVYDLSPLTVHFKETSKSFLPYFTNLCAIIGGVFTTASLLTASIQGGINSFKAKVELGKQI